MWTTNMTLLRKHTNFLTAVQTGKFLFLFLLKHRLRLERSNNTKHVYPGTSEFIFQKWDVMGLTLQKCYPEDDLR